MDSSESAKFKVDLKVINPFVSYGVSPIAKKEKGPVPSQFAESANLGEKMPKIIRKRNICMKLYFSLAKKKVSELS